MPGCRSGAAPAARRNRPAARSRRARRPAPGSSEQLLEARVVADRVEVAVVLEVSADLGLLELEGAPELGEGFVGVSGQGFEAGRVVRESPGLRPVGHLLL